MFDVDIPRKMQNRQGLDIPGYGRIPAFLHHRTERGLFSFAPFPDGRRMMVASTRDLPEPEDTPYTFEEFRAALNYVLGVDVPVTEPKGPHMKRRLSGTNTRLAERYRAGRVLLVGDAAHVHSAIGGPGLNLGLQDAVNLGWKLAATIKNWAPEGLLDTYESERRPVAERVVMQTQAQSVLIGPGPEVTAFRTLFGELLQEPAVRERIAKLISGADTKYDKRGYFSDIVNHAGRAILTDPTGKLAKVSGNWSDRVDTIRTDRPKAELIRPDGYVVWSHDDGDDKGLKTALKTWFG
jgi:hypothetical protein